ncbi:DNA primase family protein [Lysinibacillus fusiformis]|uniref:DNA primase family protein n=1 Tax=Lysinibacillus fusiformis TaxID=28031 RepID=UPI0023A94E85|nr:phage/plasmid primase, P4 family [Lysinibacillus fusiformis]WEA38591.1 phage/plasmid primase, P4 family [Lysinibacillus fusiformis]
MKNSFKFGFNLKESTKCLDDTLPVIKTFNEDYDILFNNAVPLPKKHIKSDIFNDDSFEATKPKYVSVSQIADFFIENDFFVLIKNALFIYDTKLNYYVLFHSDYADKYIRKVVPVKYKFKINSNSIKEIIQWIKASDQIKNIEHHVSYPNLIAFKNGVYNIETRHLIEHDPSKYFTSLLSVNFPEHSSTNELYYFEKFMSDITNGNASLYDRLQEILGYIISEIRDIKCIPFLIGPKDSGKSVFLKLVEYIVGENNTSNLSLDQINKPDYLVKIIGKRLNTCAEVPEINLNKLDTLKKLSGGDKITVRGVFENPIDFTNSAALLFAGNELPTIRHLDKSNAFIERLVIVPFTNKIEKHLQDITLFDKLKSEASLITLWAIEGFERLQQNNYTFTEVFDMSDIINDYVEISSPIQLFLDNYCMFDSSYRIHYSKLDKAFKNFLTTENICHITIKELHAYIKKHYALSSGRFREDSLNKNGLYGVTLKELLEEK